jgi:hypothetical protein
MVDNNIKKIVIPQSDLPPIRVEDQGYVFRYRIISDDKNRRSHWSPIKIIKPEYTFVSGNIYHNKAGQINSIVWGPVIIKKGTRTITQASEYDVWIRWDKGDSGDWIYSSQVNATSLSLITPSTYTINDVDQAQVPNKLSVEVYLKGSPITRSSSFLRVYQGGPWTV